MYNNIESIQNSRILKETGAFDRVESLLSTDPYSKQCHSSITNIEINGRKIYEDVINEFNPENQFQDYIDTVRGLNIKYPLLESIRYYNVRNQIEEVQVYIDAKGDIHPRLIGKQERLSDN
jgi:hypothetical protein